MCAPFAFTATPSTQKPRSHRTYFLPLGFLTYYDGSATQSLSGTRAPTCRKGHHFLPAYLAHQVHWVSPRRVLHASFAAFGVRCSCHSPTQPSARAVSRKTLCLPSTFRLKFDTCSPSSRYLACLAEWSTLNTICTSYSSASRTSTVCSSSSLFPQYPSILLP